MLVIAVVSRWDSMVAIAQYSQHLLTKWTPAVVTILIAVEGVVMTLSEIRTRQKVQEGRQEGLQKGRQEGLQEGRQEGLQEGLQRSIELLEQSGESSAAKILKDQNGLNR